MAQLHHGIMALVSAHFLATICLTSSEKQCQNSGTLLKNGTCLCSSNFEGETCATKKSDLDIGVNLYRNCKHGKVEFDYNNGFKMICKCEKDWEGELCDLPKCKFGGTRVDKNCQCVGSRTGTHCEEKICDKYRKWSKSRKECVCKKGSSWEGVECQFPICGRGTRIIHSNITGSCECWDPDLWFGELCDTSICSKDKGEPYHAENETVKCKCKKGWKGETCSEINCHGHGTPIGSVMCSCDGHFSWIDHCASCFSGYTGENCDQKIIYGSDSNSGNTDLSETDSSYEYGSSKNSEAMQFLLVMFVVISITCVFIYCLKKSCRASPELSPTRTYDYYSQGAVTSPVPENMRGPHTYRGTSPVDPRAPVGSSHTYATYNSDSGNFSTLNVPAAQDASSWRGGQPSAPPDTAVTPPPPAYSEVVEPLPPSYEDAVKVSL